jgi:predicted Rossmann-fold nucleotide-binding protein
VEVPPPPVEIDSLAALDAHLAAGRPLAGCVFQGLDLTAHGGALTAEPLTGAAFLGCLLDARAADHALRTSAVIFPRPEGLPYEAYRARLYTVDDLYAGYEPGVPGSYDATPDARIYGHYHAQGGAAPVSILESLYRRLHDHGLSDALDEALVGRKVVAVMGGHRLLRGEDLYLTVALVARELARSGFLVVTGGGPGAMEAAHVGVWFAERHPGELEQGVRRLAAAPLFSPIEPWLDAAFAVRAAFAPPGGAPPLSIGIPTWHYGHEPPNVFAGAIAKYFANSEREEGLLTIARHGVVFAPGSAGTIQEVFQDAAQNHYARPPHPASPMVFLGSDYWTRVAPVYPLLVRMAEGEPYGKLLCITDDPAEIVHRIQTFEAQNP